MEFSILGPLQVRHEGQVVGLGGGKPRAVLAMLLMYGNEPVSVERLAQALWGEDAPMGAVRTVQVHVSRLRRALGEQGRLVSTPAGYRLSVRPGELDAERFEGLVADGRAALAMGDHDRASEVLGRALALWRGPALADLAQASFAQREIARLEELRWAAVEARVEAELAAGHYETVVSELQRLVAEQPLRERLHGQLMLALYRSGRQADALAAYRNARHILVEQLGIEPSRELRDLERDILAQSITSPGAGGPPRATGEPRGPAAVRRRIPAPPTSFVGRGRELSEVAASVLSPGTRLLTLTGAGGSGKTRLALRVADAVAERFPDGACFVAFADISDATLIYATIGDALGQLDRTGAIPADRVHERLRDLHMLLVLDNLEHLALGAETLSGLLAACPSVKLLVTSREPLHLAAERQYQVPGLNGDDAVELFIDRAHAVARGRQIDATIARRICERLDFLPLAIELAAARVKALSPREVLSRLDARLPWLTGGPRDAPQRQRTLRATIQWSYELLDSEEQQLFARLGVFAGGCTLEAAERVCGARLDTVQALVDRSLLATDQHERYRMLETIREYALERLEQAGEADRLRRLHHEYFAGMIDAEQIFAPPRNWPPRASSVLAREQKNIRAALSWALRHKKWSGWRRL